MELIELLVMKPLSLICLLFLAWWKPVKFVVDFHVALCWKFLVFITALITFPARILAALQRQKYLEVQLQEMQIESERFVWENKELEERLRRVIKDRKVIETLLEEIEEEHEKALSRIDLLENELQDLKEESLHLNEVRGKATFDYKVHDNKRDSMGIGQKGAGIIDAQSPKDSWDDDGVKNKTQELSVLKPQSVSYPFASENFSRNPIVEAALERSRVAALYRSLFSSILSLLVGIVIWEADDPCLPLVAALFSVVGMSLGSVIRFFSSIKNKPASDAVALLSINWFILGTVTSPSLPRVARMLVPHAVRFADQSIIWFRGSS